MTGRNWNEVIQSDDFKALGRPAAAASPIDAMVADLREVSQRTDPVTVWTGPDGKRVSILVRDDEVAVMQVSDVNNTCQTVMLPIDSAGVVGLCLESIGRARAVVGAFHELERAMKGRNADVQS